jgi:hypothetical protein
MPNDTTSCRLTLALHCIVMNKRMYLAVGARLMVPEDTTVFPMPSKLGQNTDPYSAATTYRLLGSAIVLVKPIACARAHERAQAKRLRKDGTPTRDNAYALHIRDEEKTGLRLSAAEAMRW